MGLRADFAADIAQAVAENDGLGESVILAPPTGVAVTVRGVWAQSGADPVTDIGDGMATANSEATVRIAWPDAPTLDQAATITRTATGETWSQGRPPRPTPGVSWLLFLAKLQPVAARGIR